MIDSQRGARRRVGYNHLVSNKDEWSDAYSCHICGAGIVVKTVGLLYPMGQFLMLKIIQRSGVGLRWIFTETSDNKLF